MCDQVAAFSGRVVATRDGRALDHPTTFVLRLEAGKVAEVWLFDAAQDEADAFWGGQRSAAPPVAAAAAKSLPEAQDNATLLDLYALYKQATKGDATGERPGFTDPVGRAKFDAWAGLAGTAPATAMARYVDRVRGLLR